MCEPSKPIDTLRELRFSILALGSQGEKGSHKGRLQRLAAEGIVRELNWAIANLEMAGEGVKNFGIKDYALIPDRKKRVE